jgi:RHS repeat-associated protein
LTWENPKLPTDPNAVHDHAYQGKEFQFAEFTTGHGLALYDFHARMYDPCTARSLVPDPAAQFANPYLAMGNSPCNGIDPDGKLYLADDAIIGSIVFAAGYVTNGIKSGEWGMSSVKTGLIWAATALISYNTLGIASSPAASVVWGHNLPPHK